MMKRAFATTAASVLLVGAVGTAAGAATNGDGGDAKSPATSTQSAGGQRHRVLRGAIRLAVKTAADTIGVEPSALREAVRGGQTIGEFAQSKGTSPDAVEHAIVDALTARIDAAVKDGKVAEARAAKAKERVSQFAERIVTSHPRRAQGASAAPTA
jgi:hypothetical protein